MEEQLEEQFVEYLRRQDASANTIASCRASVRLFEGLYGEMTTQVTVQQLMGFKEYLLGHYKPSTVNNRIYGINRFLDFLGQTDYRLAAVRIQKLPFADSALTHEEYERLRQGLLEDQNLFWYFIVRFLACTGARVSELVQIKAEHVALGYMDLCSKGGKVRRIYFPEGLSREAAQWLEETGKRSGFLFCGRNGRPITTRGVGSQLKVLGKRYGVPEEHVYPHAFRHLFARNFLKRCNDIALLADLMGHESIETTRIYLVESSGEQREVVDRIVRW